MLYLLRVLRFSNYVALDVGCFTNPICKGILDIGGMPVIAYRLGPHVKGKYTGNKFTCWVLF